MTPNNQSVVALRILVVTFICTNICIVPVHAAQTVEKPMMPLFQLNPTGSGDREMQTRRFETSANGVVLNGCLGVLQDMGYKVTGGNRQLGLILASKKADVEGAGLGHAAAEAVLVATTIILSLLTGADMVTDLPEQVAQTIYISLLVSEETESQTRVRLSIDRDMHYDNGGVIPDHTELPLIYLEFFEKLAKSVFLEAHQL